jgi:hypothetical protein
MARTIVIPTNPKDLERMSRLIQDATDCMMRIAAEKEAIKDIVELIHEDFELPKKYANKIIRTKFKGDFDKSETEFEDFVELYEALPK